MVAGRGFVQRQRLHAELRLRLQVEGVDVKDAGARAVGRRRLIEAAGRALRAERLDLAHFVIRFREIVEQLRQLRIDVLLQIAEALHQCGAAVVVELRVVLQELEERGEIALEADLRLDLFHLAADAGDFLQAELVDRVRRQVGRGRDPGEVRIPLAAMRHRRPTHLRACALEVLVADEVVQPLVRRIDLLRDRVAVRGLQARAIGRSNGVRKTLERRVEQALLRIRGNDVLQLRQHFLHQHARIRQVLRESLAHVRDRLVRPHDVLAHAPEETVVVGGGREWLRARAGAQHRHQRRDALELVDRHQLARKLRAVDRGAQIEHEDLHAQAVGVRQLSPGKLLRLGECLAVDFERDGDVPGRESVREFVVVAVIADECRQQRVELQLALEVILEQAMQRGRVGVRAGGGRGRGLRREAGGSRQTGRERDGCQQSMNSQHDPTPSAQRRGGQFRRRTGQKKAPALAYIDA